MSGNDDLLSPNLNIKIVLEGITQTGIPILDE